MIVADLREFDSDLCQLAAIRRHLRALLEPHLVARDAQRPLNELELAVGEAACNVIRHAFEDPVGHTLRLHVQLFDDRIIVRLLHHGRAFEPGAVQPPRLDGSQLSGFGLWIIRRLVDDITYSAYR